VAEDGERIPQCDTCMRRLEAGELVTGCDSHKHPHVFCSNCARKRCVLPVCVGGRRSSVNRGFPDEPAAADKLHELAQWLIVEADVPAHLATLLDVLGINNLQTLKDKLGAFRDDRAGKTFLMGQGEFLNHEWARRVAQRVQSLHLATYRTALSAAADGRGLGWAPFHFIWGGGKAKGPACMQRAAFRVGQPRGRPHARVPRAPLRRHRDHL